VSPERVIVSVTEPRRLVAEHHVVRILDGDTELARHDRSYDRGKVIEAPEHIAALARDKRRAHELRGRDRLRSVGLHTDALLDALALRGEHLGGQTSRLLQLLDRYGAVELDRAIAEALTRGTPSTASVAHVLDEAGLDGLAEADVVGDEQVGAWQLQRALERRELVLHELHAWRGTAPGTGARRWR
jgi:hypothetical protein